MGRDTEGAADSMIRIIVLQLVFCAWALGAVGFSIEPLKCERRDAYMVAAIVFWPLLTAIRVGAWTWNPGDLPAGKCPAP